jgi:hypothetical protein
MILESSLADVFKAESQHLCEENVQLKAELSHILHTQQQDGYADDR